MPRCWNKRKKRELLTHKANVDRLLGEEQEAEKEVERRRGHGR